MKRVAVIGGGAAGLMAAITAARNGAEVTIYEKNDRVGKKILATGNGKCNFSNRDFDVQDYYGNSVSADMLRSLFAQFTVEDTINFFEELGMLVKEKKGYLYPLSEQASTVLDSLRLETKRLKINIKTSAPVKAIVPDRRRKTIQLQWAEGTEEYPAVILTCGGCAAPKTGSDGSGYVLAEKLGHRVTATVPALVQLRCSDALLKITAGVRCEAEIKLQVREGDKQAVQTETGELQFTDYGISGIPVFQLSRTAAYLLKEGKKPVVSIDLLPNMERQDFERMCEARLAQIGEKSLEEFLLGMANKKINQLLLRQAGMNPSHAAGDMGIKALKKLLYSYRALCVHVTAVNSFEHAQVAAGGVDMGEVTTLLESVKVPGVFFAGELLDVDGRCGGYNLQWAWTSGYIAGKNAAVTKK